MIIVTVHFVHSNLVKIHSISPSVMGFCPVCLGILSYTWQNTSRNITCEQLLIIHFSQPKYQAVNLSLLSVSYSHPILLFVPLYTLFISPFLFFWQSIIDWKSLYHFTHITSIEYSLLFPISTPITVYSILHNSPMDHRYMFFGILLTIFIHIA